MALTTSLANLVALYPSLAEGCTSTSIQYLSGSDRSALRKRILDAVGKFPDRACSRRSIVAQSIYANGSTTRAYSELRPLLQDHPFFTFSKNEAGARRPLDMGSAMTRFCTLINQMAPVVERIKRAEAENGEVPEGAAPTPEAAPEAAKPEPKGDAATLKAWLDKWRNWCEHRNADGQPVDEVGMRPYEYGAKMLKAGLPIKAIKDALIMDRPAEARRAIEAHVIAPLPARPEYDPASYGEREDGKHPALAYLYALAKAGVPAAMVGPKGTGKSTLARQLAEKMFGDDAVEQGKFGMVSMTNGTSPSAFYGRPKIGGDGGVIESLFVKCYREGGVFLFDEMDAANENLLLIVNAALANGHFANPQTGEIVQRHPDFVPVAAMNTLGIGADRHYTGRNKQDAAALDRWAAGRTQIKFDETLAHAIFDSNV